MYFPLFKENIAWQGSQGDGIKHYHFNDDSRKNKNTVRYFPERRSCFMWERLQPRSTCKSSYHATAGVPVPSVSVMMAIAPTIGG